MASSLPAELWGEVFKKLQPVPAPHFLKEAPQLRNPEPVLDWRCTESLDLQVGFWQLPRVCKIFRDVISVQPVLTRHVTIYKADQPNKGLVTWLRARSALVKSLDSSISSELMIECLAALATPSPQLVSVSLRADCYKTLQLLTAFTTLCTCHIISSRLGGTAYSEHRDLGLLQSLPLLTDLTLTGKFCSLSAASYLTRLELCDTHADSFEFEGCSFSSRLQSLHLCESKLSITQDISSFSALRSLDFKGHCEVNHMAYQDHDNPGEADDTLQHLTSWGTYKQISASITCLALLTSLHWSCDFGANLDLSIVCALSGLRDLDLVAPGDIHVSQAFHSLSHLTRLSIEPGHSRLATFSVDWNWFVYLQLLRISTVASFFEANTTMLKLLDMKHMQQLTFDNAHVLNKCSGMMKDLLSRSDHGVRLEIIKDSRCRGAMWDEPFFCALCQHNQDSA